ncbi:MAG TPA: LamG domain-containing protein, partial [Thermoleophilaceae bacterium]
MVAGVFDGARVRLYVDGAEVGTGTPAPAISYGLSGNQFYVDGYPVSVCGNGDFPGGIDELRLYDRALSASEIARLASASGPNPPTLVPDTGSGGTAPPPPAVTGVAPAQPIAAGKPTVLTAAVTGAVSKLEWNLKGDSRPEIVSEAGQTSLRLRPRPGVFDVEVTAVGPGGTSAPIAQAFTAPPVKLSGAAAKLDKKLATADPVYAAGPAGALLTPARIKDVCYTNSVMRSGSLEIHGCLDPITGPEDLPARERGIVQVLQTTLLSGKKGPLGLRMLGTVLNLTDGYLARGSVTVNGVTLRAEAGAAVAIFPQANAIVSSNARLEVGKLKLANQRDFTLRTTDVGGQIPLGQFARLAGGLPRIAGFKLAGDVKITLLAPNGATPAEAQITASLQLPEFLKLGGVDFQSQVKLRATYEQGLIVDNLTIGPLNADIGALAVNDFRLDYTRAGDEWRGQGRACVVSGACLDMIPPNGSVVIKNGSLSFAGASLAFPPPGIPLFPGLSLDRIGFGFGLDPTRLTGNAKLTALSVYEIDGRLVLAFPSPQTPYAFAREEVGNGFPATFYGRTHTQPTVGISADASIKVPVVGSVHLGNGYFLYEYPGYVAFGGSVQQGIAGVLTFEGGLAGEFNASNGRFNLSGHVRTCLIDVVCRGAFGLISSRGVAGCIELGPVNIGAGVRYSPFSISVWPLDGCKWSPFAEQNVRGATAAQEGSAYTVRVRRGDPSRAIRLDGNDAAPRVRVTGPGGQLLESSAGPGLETKGALRIIRSEQAKLIVVGLQDPRPGTYRIEQLLGSPAVAKVTEATDPADARATVKVRGHGARRTLAYDVRRRPSQRVTFVEVAADGGAKPIGSVAGGGRGTLQWTPAPGRGKRTIEARFELAGLPAEQRTVARFTAPSARLGKPAMLRVRRRGTSLRVSWARVADAARYELVATSSGSPQRVHVTRKRSAVLKGVAP